MTVGIWIDVRHASALAQAAAQECRGSARKVEDALAALEDLGGAIQGSWYGGASNQFDAAERDVRRSLTRLTLGLATLARSIDQAIDAAETEQRRREHLRAEALNCDLGGSCG